MYQSGPWNQTNTLEPVGSGGKTGWWTNIRFLIHILTTCQNSAGGRSPCQHLGLNPPLHLLYHLWAAFIHRSDKFADAMLEFICKVYLFAVRKSPLLFKYLYIMPFQPADFNMPVYSRLSCWLECFWPDMQWYPRGEWSCHIPLCLMT